MTREGIERRKEAKVLIGEGGRDFEAHRQSQVGARSSAWSSPRKIDKDTIALLNAQVAQAYEETRKQEEELKRTVKMPTTMPLRRSGRKIELLAARLEADFYISTVKEEQLVKLAKTFKVPDDVNFHMPTPSCCPSKPPPGY